MFYILKIAQNLHFVIGDKCWNYKQYDILTITYVCMCVYIHTINTYGFISLTWTNAGQAET